MERVTGAAEEATAEALMSHFRAQYAPTTELREQHQRMAKGWRALAQHYREVERLSGYIQWQAQRVDPPWS